MDEELKILEDLQKHARVQRNSRNPRLAMAAVKWEIFFGERIAELKASMPVGATEELEVAHG